MLTGAVLGFLYWQFYGCTEGCAITSKWYGSVFMGGIIGNLTGSMLTDILNKQRN